MPHGTMKISVSPFLSSFLRFVCAGVAILTPFGNGQCASVPAHAAFIENGKVRIGIDLDSGGCIFYFSEKSPERNMLNHCDKGRFIQQSYYGDPDGSFWGDKPFRWNPVQGGDCKGSPAKTLASSITADRIYVKSEPKHWASGEDVPAATMEESIDLRGDIAHIHFKFTYKNGKDNAATDQELPAVFADYALNHLVFYNGTKPWADDVLTRKIPGFPNEPAEAVENWAAYVDNNDWGLGVYFPGTTRMTTYRTGSDSTAGPEGSACSYFAPIQTLAITRNWSHEYDIYLMIGKISTMRNKFYWLHRTQHDSER
jgi:hypothetical protein